MWNTKYKSMNAFHERPAVRVLLSLMISPFFDGRLFTSHSSEATRGQTTHWINNVLSTASQSCWHGYRLLVLSLKGEAFVIHYYIAMTGYGIIQYCPYTLSSRQHVLEVKLSWHKWIKLTMLRAVKNKYKYVLSHALVPQLQHIYCM